MWAYRGGEVTHGPYHIFQGLFVSVIGFVILFILAWGLAKIPLNHIKESRPDKERVTISQQSDFKQFNLSWLMAVICLLCLGSFMYLYKPKPVPLKAPLSEMPLMIGDWQGENTSDNSTPFRIKGADYELSRVYKNSSGQEVRLQISYFETQGQGKELINYTLQRLYDNSRKIAIPINSIDHIQTNIAVLNDKRQDSLVLYWYDLDGHAIADNYKAKFITAMDGLFRRRTNGALIMVSGTINTSDKDIALNNQMDFVRKLFPFLKILLP
jgi:EpsI family protein